MDRAEGILVWMDKEFYYVQETVQHTCSHCGMSDDIDMGELLMFATEEI